MSCRGLVSRQFFFAFGHDIRPFVVETSDAVLRRLVRDTRCDSAFDNSTTIDSSVYPCTRAAGKTTSVSE
jgi:hypothetical protein